MARLPEIGCSKKIPALSSAKKSTVVKNRIHSKDSNRSPTKSIEHTSLETITFDCGDINTDPIFFFLRFIIYN